MSVDVWGASEDHDACHFGKMSHYYKVTSVGVDCLHGRCDNGVCTMLKKYRKKTSKEVDHFGCMTTSSEPSDDTKLETGVWTADDSGGK